MERETGIEPATSSLGSWHSTAELLPLVRLLVLVLVARKHDVKSAVFLIRSLAQRASRPTSGPVVICEHAGPTLPTPKRLERNLSAVIPCPRGAVQNRLRLRAAPHEWNFVPLLMFFGAHGTPARKGTIQQI